MVRLETPMRFTSPARCNSSMAPQVSVLLDPSADLRIFHPKGDLKIESFHEARPMLEEMLVNLGEGTWSERDTKVRVSGDVAWYTGRLRIRWPNRSRCTPRSVRYYWTASPFRINFGRVPTSRSH